MDEEKKDIDLQDENDVENKNKEDNNKPKKKLSRKEKREQEEQDLNEKISLLSSQLEDSGIETNLNVKGMVIRNKHNFLYALLEVVIGFGLLMALTGLFTWVNHTELYIILIVLFGISLIDNMIAYLIKRFLFKIYMKTLGLIRLLPTIIIFTLITLFGKYINFVVISYGGMIATSLLYVAIKAIIMILIKGSFIRNLFKK